MSLARLTQLFAEGTELVLTPLQTPGEPPLEPIVLWIAKLNSFEEEQANQAGRVARARLINAIKEIGTPEFDHMRAEKGEQLSISMVQAIVQTKESELFLRAMNDLRSDDSWHERWEILDLTDETKLEGIEKEAHTKLRNEHTAALLDLHQKYMDDYRAELEGMAREDLEDHFERAYLDEQGMAAFALERGRQHIFLCMRSCEATPPPDDDARWDHSKCNHMNRYLASDEEVRHLPQVVRDQVEEAYASVTLAPSMARFTDALASSSESPERSSLEEDSAPSGPVATSVVPVTTS